MQSILIKGKLVYLMEFTTIKEDDFFFDVHSEFTREQFSFKRRGYKLIKTNDPLFPSVDGLGDTYHELIKKYPQGLTQDFDKPEELKERIDGLRRTIEGLIEEERQVAREVDEVVDKLLEELKKDEALKLSEQIFANHAIFLSYFRKKINKFGSHE